MRAPEGGFYSALDADSEGEEGKFYVWTLAELREALGDDADAAIRWLGATERGNFVDPHHPRPAGAPGLNVLEDRGPRPDDATRARIRARLLEVRERRVPPGLDDKRLTAWNALLIAALADAGAVLGREDHLAAARDAAVFCCEHLREDGGRGRLLRTSDGRQAKIRAYLEDHAFLLEALLVLFEATGEPRWFVEARRLGDELLEHFATPSAAASSPPPTTATGSSRGARSSRTRRSRGRLERRPRAAAAGRADGRAPLRRGRRGPAAPRRRHRGPPSRGLRAPAAGARPAPGRRSGRWRSWAPRPSAPRWWRSSASACAPTWSSRRARRRPGSGSRGPAARRAATSSTAARRRTSASASRAGGPSRARASCARCWPDHPFPVRRPATRQQPKALAAPYSVPCDERLRLLRRRPPHQVRRLRALVPRADRALAFNLPGKYTEAEENESSSFLPADAESTKALAITERLQDGERAPTVIVYQREGGSDAGRPAGHRGRRAGAQRHHRAVPQHLAVRQPGRPRGPEPFQVSEDGTTALVVNSIEARASRGILDPVDAYREAVTARRAGWT
jgi:hypothetical protein